MRDYKLYLRDILESISRIENSSKNISREEFDKNVDVQDSTLRRLEIIGEAVTNLPEEIKSKFPKVEWKKIAGFRVIVAHTYFKINLDIIWNILEEKIPQLKKDILLILE